MTRGAAEALVFDLLSKHDAIPMAVLVPNLARLIAERNAAAERIYAALCTPQPASVSHYRPDDF